MDISAEGRLFTVSGELTLPVAFVQSKSDLCIYQVDNRDLPDHRDQNTQSQSVPQVLYLPVYSAAELKSSSAHKTTYARTCSHFVSHRTNKSQSKGNPLHTPTWSTVQAPLPSPEQCATLNFKERLSTNYHRLFFNYWTFDKTKSC